MCILQGICCPGPVGQSGHCCSSGFVDECGVCDGDASSCSIILSVGLRTDVDALAVTPQLWQQKLTSRLTDLTGAAVTVLPYPSPDTQEAKTRVPGGLNVTFLARLSYINGAVPATAVSGASAPLTAESGWGVTRVPASISASGPFRFTLSEIIPAITASLRQSPLISTGLGLTTLSPGGVSSPNVTIYMVERGGICGNGICEVGEQLWMEPSAAAGQVRA